MKKVLSYLAAAILAAFGFLTLFLSTSVILDLFGVRAQEGNYVLFIVWANFISSLLYLFAAYGFIKTKKWTVQLLGISAIVLVSAFVGLLFHINTGGIYETKTIGAMIFRITVTLVFLALAYFTINKNKKP
ncbi:MAG: hypothetical protein Q8N05_21650 [Bacteroidota bacterium]|nr:hypothetical protein [Bacteroidota bacterium]